MSESGYTTDSRASASSSSFEAALHKHLPQNMSMLFKNQSTKDILAKKLGATSLAGVGKKIDADAIEVQRHETFTKLTSVVKFGYGLPQFSMLSLTLIISIYGNTYYEKMGASLSYIAFFTALARSFDVMTDPLMGWVSDNTRSCPSCCPAGRRRPYMIFGMWGFAASFAALMYPPISDSPTDNSTSIWFGIFYVVFYLFDTVTNVPYGALGPELTSDSDERTSVFFWAKLFSGIGTLIGATSPELVQTALCAMGADKNMDTSYLDVKLDNGTVIEAEPDCQSLRELQRLSFLTVSVVFGLFYLMAMGFVVYNVKERRTIDENQKKAKPIPLVPSILRSFKNPAFKPLLVGWVFDAIALASLAALFPFFITYVIVREFDENPETELTSSETQALCFGALFVAALFAMPIWKLLAHYMGKYRTWLAYNLLNSLTNSLYIFVDAGDPWYTIGITCLNGVPVGAQFLIDSILADVIDYDEFLNGTRNEGGFTVFATFIPKFVSVPAGAIPLAMIAMMGFKPSVNGEAQEQTPAVTNFIRFVFVILPVACTLIAFFSKLSYPIKKKADIQAINEGIELHQNGFSAKDPVSGQFHELMDFNDDEEYDIAWVIDNFSHHDLRKFLAAKEADGDEGNTAGDVIINQMWKWVFGTFLVFVFFGGILAVAFLVPMSSEYNSILDDPTLSIIPIIDVVLVGMSFCVFAIAILRLKAAYELRGIDKKRDLTDLVTRIVAHKERGGRGGDPLELTEEIDRLHAIMAELGDEIRSLEAEVRRLKLIAGESMDDEGPSRADTLLSAAKSPSINRKMPPPEESEGDYYSYES